MPTIRIDEEVYAWLKSQAEPFEDNPNTVLRRVAGLDTKEGQVDRGPKIVSERLTAKKLCEMWKVDARHSLYHKEGTFYENLRRFPGALFDYNGYVIFETEQDYRTSPYLLIGQKLNVPRGISSIPGYMKRR